MRPQARVSWHARRLSCLAAPSAHRGSPVIVVSSWHLPDPQSPPKELEPRQYHHDVRIRPARPNGARSPPTVLRVSVDPEKEFVEREHDLDRDESDDVPFESDGPLILHELEKRADRIANQRQLPIDRLAALY